MLDTLNHLARRSGGLALAPAKKLWSAANNSSRELAHAVSNGGAGLRGVVMDSPRARGRGSDLREDGAGGDDRADVLLDVPLLKVDEIELDVENLEAHVSLEAELANLVKLNVGADVRLGKVDLTIKGVEAEALLKVRLDQVAAILDRALTTIDQNPQILERLADTVRTTAKEVGGTAQNALGEGGAVDTAAEQIGGTAQTALEGGGAVDEAVKGAGRFAQDAGQVAQGAGQAAQGAADEAGGAVEPAGLESRAAARDATTAKGGAGRRRQKRRRGSRRSSSERAGGADGAATEAAQRQAREGGVDLDSVDGTGANGRITVSDVRRAAGSG